MPGSSDAGFCVTGENFRGKAAPLRAQFRDSVLSSPLAHRGAPQRLDRCRPRVFQPRGSRQRRARGAAHGPRAPRRGQTAETHGDCGTGAASRGGARTYTAPVTAHGQAPKTTDPSSRRLSDKGGEWV